MGKSNGDDARKPEAVEDSLSELLRSGARKLIHQAIEAELAELLAQYEGKTDEQGRAAVVRNGYLPEGEVVTGLGPVSVRVPKVRSSTDESVRFRSSVVPPYVRRARTLDVAPPLLYLKGISTGQMQEVLEVLVGSDANGLSASVVSRLKRQWLAEYEAWRRIRLDEERWVYLWVDGIYSGLRAEHQRLCLLVVIGLNEHGEKRFLAIEDGVRESTQSWREVLLDLKARGLDEAPELAVGDGAMGFWAALEEVFPATRHQRCWMHIRTTNPVESTLGTIRDRTDRAKGCVTRDNMLAFTFKPAMCAQCRWRRITATGQLGRLIDEVKFRDGIAIKASAERPGGTHATCSS